jgi:glycosyltransferase involved in cell wall biosynthesis
VDDLAEKINFMLSDSKRLQMMGRESRKKTEETYSAEIHYRKMMKIYEQVLP